MALFAPAVVFGQVAVLTSGGFAAAYQEVIPAFEKASGLKVTTTRGASQGSGPTTIPSQIRNGAAIDVVIMSKEGLNDLALTSNGILLADQVEELKAAGLRRVTVSLDTLRHDRFAQLARFDELTRVRRGIEAASRAFEIGRAHV